MNTMNVVVLLVIMLTFGEAGDVDTIDLRKLVRNFLFFEIFSYIIS